MALEIDCFGDTHVGKRRPTNEDQFLIADLNKSMRVHQTSLGLNHQSRLFGGSQGKLLLVADGLGGHESGERASTLAVDGVANYVLNAMDWFFRLNEENREEFEAELIESFAHSQRKLMDEAEAIPHRHGMATTLTMAFIMWPEMYVVHVGDTRCYHLTAGEISRLTKDHTVANLLREEDATVDDAPLSVNSNTGHMSNELWNVVGGTEESLQPQLAKATLAKGDALVLCSDGLTNYVADDELLKTIKETKSAKAACSQLIRMANDRGGADNTTTIVAKFTEPTVTEDGAYKEADTATWTNKPEDDLTTDEVLVVK